MQQVTKPPYQILFTFTNKKKSSQRFLSLYKQKKSFICILKGKEQNCDSNFGATSPEPGGFPGSSAGKEYACNTGHLGLILGFGRCPGGGHGKPHQYSCLENPQGQRSLVDCSPWGCRESDMAEWLSILQHSPEPQGNISSNRQEKEAVSIRPQAKAF